MFCVKRSMCPMNNKPKPKPQPTTIMHSTDNNKESNVFSKFFSNKKKKLQDRGEKQKKIIEDWIKDEISLIKDLVNDFPLDKKFYDDDEYFVLKEEEEKKNDS